MSGEPRDLGGKAPGAVDAKDKPNPNEVRLDKAKAAAVKFCGPKRSAGEYVFVMVSQGKDCVMRAKRKTRRAAEDEMAKFQASYSGTSDLLVLSPEDFGEESPATKAAREADEKAAREVANLAFIIAACKAESKFPVLDDEFVVAEVKDGEAIIHLHSKDEKQARNFLRNNKKPGLEFILVTPEQRQSAVAPPSDISPAGAPPDAKASADAGDVAA